MKILMKQPTAKVSEVFLSVQGEGSMPENLKSLSVFTVVICVARSATLLRIIRRKTLP